MPATLLMLLLLTAPSPQAGRADHLTRDAISDALDDLNLYGVDPEDPDVEAQLEAEGVDVDRVLRRRARQTRGRGGIAGAGPWWASLLPVVAVIGSSQRRSDGLSSTEVWLTLTIPLGRRAGAAGVRGTIARERAARRAGISRELESLKARPADGEAQALSRALRELLEDLP